MMRKEFGTLADLHRAHFQLRNWALTIFTTLTGLLLLSVTYMITLNDPAVFLLVITGTTVAGLIMFMNILYATGRRVPRSPLWRIPTMFAVCSIALVASFYAHTRYFAGIETTTIQNMTFADPVPLALTLTEVFVATIQSLAAVGK